MSINNPFFGNLTLLPFERTLVQVKDYSKTVADAQAFINSVKEFNNEPAASSVSDIVGDSTSVGLYTSNAPLELENKNTSKTGPVGKFEGNNSRFGFPTLNFSPKKEYDHPFRADLLTFIEVYYHENRRLPDVHVLHEHFNDHPERPNFLKGWNPVLDAISDSLNNRGIKPYNTVENYIDPKFAYAVSLIVNYLDKRTMPAKLKEAGLKTSEWQNYLRRKRYYEYYQSRLDEVFDQDVKNSAKISLTRMIENGDLQAIKYYNELKNIYRPETQNALQMVSIVLTAVMEILAQNVSSELLNKVAADIRTSPTVRKIIEAESR